MKVLVVEPKRKPRVADIEDTLEALQGIVGGLVECLYPFEDEVALVCNEEGKVEGLPLNRALYDEDGVIYEIIAGDFFIIGAPADAENFTDLTQKQIDKFTELFSKIETFYMTPSGIVVDKNN